MQEQFHKTQVVRACDLGVGQVADDELDRLADKFAGGGVVRDEEATLPDLGEGAADEFDAEGLRRLDGPKAGAIQVRSTHWPSWDSFMVSATG